MDKNNYLKFIGSLTKNGKKSVAKKILDTTMHSVSLLTQIPNELIQDKIDDKLNAFMEVKSITRGKRTHLIPVIVNFKRQNFLIRNWLIASANENSRKVSFTERLTSEILDVLTKKKSKAIEKKNSLTTLVKANRSNLHFRW
jgi:small subunit ribosomal protein S7